jgi:phage FluMu protein Com
MGTMAPKFHPTPLSGGDRKALQKELGKSRAMTGILARQSDEARSAGEALIRKADNLACQSWNERMWSDGGPAQPSPTIGQAINGGFPWLEVQCSRCKTISSVDLCEIKRPQDTCVHQLEEALRCRKCSRSKWRPRGVLHQLAPSRRHTPPEA